MFHDPEMIRKLGRKPNLKKVLAMKNLGCYIDHKIVALLSVEDSKKSHFHCLKSHRRRAVEIARMLIDAAPEGIYFRVSSKAIENFGKKLGFKVKE